VNKHTEGRVQDDGYDYADESEHTLIIYLSCASPDTEVQDVIRLLREHAVCGNKILDSAVIGISEDSHEFEIVHPAHGGKFTVREW